ncbi:MAG: hypothetical protein CMN78_01370 [Spirochaetales bacterium]|nr:hypothetical protein [Spirochaetales bacterium]
MDIQTVNRISGDVEIRNIIVSVADKTGLDFLIPGLLSINPELKIYSTGGTYGRIQEIVGENHSEILVAISDYTGQPEMQGGLVKTLDFRLYLGLLSETYNPAHLADLERTEAVEFDMVVVNLYPFDKAISKAGSTVEDARGNIDIGGPCMLRAAAKNFLRVAPICEPQDYSRIVDQLKRGAGRLTVTDRLTYAKKAFAHTAEYESAISAYFANVAAGEITDTYKI